MRRISSCPSFTTSSLSKTRSINHPPTSHLHRRSRRSTKYRPRKPQRHQSPRNQSSHSRRKSPSRYRSPSPQAPCTLRSHSRGHQGLHQAKLSGTHPRLSRLRPSQDQYPFPRTVHERPPKAAFRSQPSRAVLRQQPSKQPARQVLAHLSQHSRTTTAIRDAQRPKQPRCLYVLPTTALQEHRLWLRHWPRHATRPACASTTS